MKLTVSCDSCRFSVILRRELSMISTVKRAWRARFRRLIPVAPEELLSFRREMGQRRFGSIPETPTTFLRSFSVFRARSEAVVVMEGWGRGSPVGFLVMTCLDLLGREEESVCIQVLLAKLLLLRTDCPVVSKTCTKGPQRRWRSPGKLLMPVGKYLILLGYFVRYKWRFCSFTFYYWFGWCYSP